MGKEIDDLTSEQRQRLNERVAVLEELPTPERIVEAGLLRCPLPLTDASRARFRQVMSGGIAAHKILAYIELLRGVDTDRQRFGEENFDAQMRAAALIEAEDVEAARFLVQANRLSGIQEVTFHFFAICVGRIERYLPFMTRPAGYKMSKEDRDLLASYRPLRDYYEHLEDHLPTAKDPGDVVEIVETSDTITMRMALKTDDQDRVVLDGKPIDVTSWGRQAAEEVVERVWPAAGARAIEEVREHFINDPTNIPSPERLNRSLLSRSSPIRREHMH